MASKNKKTRHWQWANSIMWWAFIISGIIHLCLVYLLPSVDFLPSDQGYIEVVETWITSFPEENTSGELADELVNEGTEPADTQDSPETWSILPQVQAIEPAPAIERTTDNTWGTDFIGLDPALSNTLEQPEFRRNVSVVQSDVPQIERNQAVIRTYPKQIPASDLANIPASEPDVADAEVQAEQRFEEFLSSQMRQRAEEEIEPERLLAAVPEILDSNYKISRTTPFITRQFSEQSVVQRTSVQVNPEQTAEKSLPPLILPDTPEQEPLPEEETIALTDPVMTFPATMITAQAEHVVVDRSEPDYSSQPPVLSRNALSVESFLPKRDTQPESPRQQVFSLVAPIVANGVVLKGVSIPLANTPKETLTQDDVQLQADDVQLQARTRTVPQKAVPVSPRPERSPDALRALTPKVVRKPDLSSEMPASRQESLSGTKRSFILGAKDSVPTLPLEGPRFGILTQKETTLPEEELTPDTELYPEESFEQTEQNRKEDIAATLIIEGPAANRQVLFKPRQFPEVELDMEVTIRLKFWVWPDGTVADVVPLQRGDVRLERAAIEYLKNWRFTPVPRNQPQVWGILPITYTFIER